MGAGIYLVWPAFYTDVTDAYRLPRRRACGPTSAGSTSTRSSRGHARHLAATGIEALLLLIAIQLLEIVKNLSPVIRADGYHILSEATGVPDLYAHIGPTLKRLLPWRQREPSALKGRAASSSPRGCCHRPDPARDGPQRDPAVPEARRQRVGERIQPRSAMPGQTPSALSTSSRACSRSRCRCSGATLIVSRLVTSMGKKAWGWSEGGAPRQALVVTAAAGHARCSRGRGGRRPVPAGPRDRPRHAGERPPDGRARRPPSPAPPARAAPPRLAPGRHLAVALIPRGGPTEEHPRCTSSTPARRRRADRSRQPGRAGHRAKRPRSGDAERRRGRHGDAPGRGRRTGAPASGAPATPTAPGDAAPVQLPDAPGEDDSQALAANTTDGGIVTTSPTRS